MSYSPHRDRLRRAKSEVTHNRISTDCLRNEFRNRFFSRLGSSRSKSVDRFRQIVIDYGNNIQYKSISDLRKALLQDNEARNLLMTEEVNDILNQIENELAQVHLQQEGEQYITGDTRETEDIVSRHLTVCNICDTLNEDGNICGECSAILGSDFD